MSNDFDMACRRMVKDDPQPFLRWLFTDFDELAEHVGWVDTRRLPFPGKTDQTGDLVFKLKMLQIVQTLWALALEFQLEPDPALFGRMMIYLGTLWMERRPDKLPGARYNLASSVINLTGTSKSTPGSASFVWPGSDKLRCELQLRERYLAEEPAEGLIAGIDEGRWGVALLPWLPLHRGGGAAKMIDAWLRLAEPLRGKQKGADLWYDTLVFAQKSENPKAWRKSLEGWAMVKSKVMEQTRNEGRIEGRIEGRDEGVVVGIQTIILDLLSDRFGPEFPSDLATAIRSSSDPDQLRSWGKLAARVPSLQAFREQAGI